MSVGCLAPDCLDGRLALVTGAGSGIGRAVAERLAALGCAVIGVGRRAAALEETGARIAALGGRFEPLPGDLRRDETVAAVARRLADGPGLDLLVNNAGGQFYAPAAAISRRGWDAVIDLNLTALFTLIQACRPALARRRGAVVNLSLSGVERGSTGLAHTIAARAGVLGLTRTLALEWAPFGIRLNCLAPGLVETPAFAGAASAETLARLRAAIPLGRATDPAEVAELVAFLATPAAAMITGQLLHLDGGAALGPGLHMLEGAPSP